MQRLSIRSARATVATAATWLPFLVPARSRTLVTTSWYSSRIAWSPVSSIYCINSGPAQPQFSAACWCISLALASSSKGAPITSSTRVFTPVWLLALPMGSSPVARITLRQVRSSWRPPSLLPLFRPVPLASIYTIFSRPSCLLPASWRSSMPRGRSQKKPAIRSRATWVALKFAIRRSGSPQAERAAFRAAVLPPRLPPQLYTKKMRCLMIARRGAAKLAARINLNRWRLRCGCIQAAQASRVPLRQ